MAENTFYRVKAGVLLALWVNKPHFIAAHGIQLFRLKPVLGAGWHFAEEKLWENLQKQPPDYLNTLLEKFKHVSLSQNSVSFVPSSWKKRLKAVFSIKSKVAVPKTEVLGQPHVIGFYI